MSLDDKIQKGISAVPDDRIKKEIHAHAADGKLSCAQAFEISKKLDVLPSAVGHTADGLKVRLVKCQLGLFGYYPEKKIVKPAESVTEDLRIAIESVLVDGRLSCVSAWEIAQKNHIPKMAVSAVSESMGIKIKPCQLGAF